MNAPHRGNRLLVVSLVLALAGVAALVAFLPLGRSGDAGSPPRATTPAALVEAGRDQFARIRHTEVAVDPARTTHPLFNARSCAECHRQGGTGGGGPNENNVQLFETGFNLFDSQLAKFLNKSGGVAVLPRHGLAPEYAAFRFNVLLRFNPNDPEVAAWLKSRPQEPVGPPPTPMVSRGGKSRLLIRSGISFDAVDERNTPPLFGLGLLESIPQGAIDAVALSQSPTIRGRSPRLKGGGFGRFGWKSSTASLLAFNENACAVELGLTTPNFVPAMVRQSDLRPDPTTASEGMLGTLGATSRFGLWARRVARLPIDPTMRAASPPATPDMSDADVLALTRYVASLPAPRQVVDPARLRMVADGERHFHAIGCAGCHTPKLGGVAGVYSDLLLHQVGTTGGGFYGGPTPSPDATPDFDIVQAEEFRTPPLWGVADSGPYMHDGGAPTLNSAILRHALQASEAAVAYQARLNNDEQQSLLAFLESLRAPQ